MLLVALGFRIVRLAANQTLSVKDSVFRVRVEGVLGGITDTTTNVRNLTQRVTDERLTVVLHRRRRPMRE